MTPVSAHNGWARPVGKVSWQGSAKERKRESYRFGTDLVESGTTVKGGAGPREPERFRSAAPKEVLVP